MIRLWVADTYCADAYGFTVQDGVIAFRGQDRRDVITRVPTDRVKIPASAEAEFWYHCASSSATPRRLLAQVQHLDSMAARTPGWDRDGRPLVSVEIPVEFARPEWFESPAARLDRLRNEILAGLDTKLDS